MRLKLYARLHGEGKKDGANMRNDQPVVESPAIGYFVNRAYARLDSYSINGRPVCEMRIDIVDSNDEAVWSSRSENKTGSAHFVFTKMLRELLESGFVSLSLNGTGRTAATDG